MNNSKNQHSKPDPKPEAIAALTLGTITIFLALILVVAYCLDILMVYVWGPWEPFTLLAVIAGFSFYWDWLFSSVGVVLGIMGLKSTKKKTAMIGIILSSMALVIDIYMYILAYLHYH